jgi:hypothetical protein
LEVPGLDFFVEDLTSDEKLYTTLHCSNQLAATILRLPLVL